MNSPRVARTFRITRAWTLALSLGAALLSYAGEPARARACYVAHQYRVFPLGVQGDQLIAVRIEQTRFTEDMKSAILWGATVSLVEMGWYGEPLRELASEKVEVKDKAYARELQPALARAAARARALEGFEAFSAPKTLFCDLEPCRFAKWSRTAGGQLAVDLKLGAGGRGLAAVLPERVKDELYGDGMNFYQLYPRRRLLDVFAEYPSPFSSIRVYRAGGRTVFVAHTTDGQMVGEGADGDDFDMVRGRLSRLPPGACKDVFSCMYREPIPHHGRGFDLVLTAGATPPPTPVIAALPEDDDDYGWTDADRREQEERKRLEKAERERERAEREELRFLEQARIEAEQQWPYPDEDEDEDAWML